MPRSIRTAFLSSTGADLFNHREAVFAAVQKLDGWKCIRMEDFSARDAPPLAECRAKVAASDLFIGLIGHYHGSCPPKPDHALSFTEHEYAEAERLGKPRLMFLASTDFPMPAKLREPDWKHKRQQKFRAEVGKSQVVPFFEEPAALATRVIEAIHNWERDHSASGEAAPSALPGDSPARATRAAVQASVENFKAFYLGAPGHPAPFGGRGHQLAELDAWLRDPAAPGKLLITAPAGRGKSALLVHWAETIALEVALAFVPVSIRYETSRAVEFYRILADRLAEILYQELPSPLTDPELYYRGKVLEFLGGFIPQTKLLVVIVDGLDEATGWEPGANLFPAHPKPGVRLVVSAREQVGDQGPAGWLRRLGWERDPVRTIALPPLDEPGVAQVLDSMGFPLADLAGDVDIVQELLRLSEGDPLLLGLYTEDLWRKGEAAARLTPKDLAALKPGFAAYFANWLDDQRKAWTEEAYDDDLTNAILAILTCALGPLQHADLAELVQRVFGLKTFFTQKSLVPLRRFVLGDGRDQGYVLSHPKLADYLRQDYFRNSPQIRSTLQGYIDWGRETIRQLNAGALAPADAPAYLLLFHAQHLRQQRADPLAFMEMVSNGWRLAWLTYQGSDRGFANDIRYAWQALTGAGGIHPQSSQGIPYLGEQIRCILCLSSIHSAGSNIEADLLALAVETGVVSARQALDLVDLKHDSFAQAEALAKLARLIPPTMLSEALAAARAIYSEYARAHALRGLAAHLAEPLRRAAVEEALAAARAIQDDRTRADALSELAVHLPKERRPEMLPVALGTWHHLPRGELLRTIVSFLPVIRQIGGEPALQVVLQSIRETTIWWP